MNEQSGVGVDGARGDKLSDDEERRQGDDGWGRGPATRRRRRRRRLDGETKDSRVKRFRVGLHFLNTFEENCFY